MTGLALGRAFDTPPGVATLAVIGGTLLGAGIFAASAHRAVRRVVEPEARAIPKTSPHFALDPGSAPVAGIVAYLQEHLGPEVTAYVSGADEKAAVGPWVSGQARPDELSETRLRFAYAAARSIISAYDGETAQAWLFGMNDRLNDEAPAYVLRHRSNPKDLYEVVQAAEEFVEFLR